ncbi:TetR/AcrR family transcriptional regulator C-terminal domain-containing protein [Youngiibacter fragilis]|uniref:TetR family transcriptional regulator n=1 Tax=Youngiibacter fragilis 232.1 TaxID=994573 RepID=V7I8K4_9CLOT|nr:TetR/AcrR family transcriptional regulator C-terminal domain-containing protein [Youngiibacter fragilis]ETA82183.1 TetR family transcriptional regulator [Youngiibacter fragilis 232.1]
MKKECTEPARLIYEAMSKLLQTKSIESLTVNEIISTSGVSRATFYRHFMDKYDVMTSYYKSILESTLFTFNDGVPWRDAVCSIYGVIRDNPKFFQNAFRCQDANSLKCFIYSMSRELHLDILRRNGVDISDWKVVTAMESYIYGGLEITDRWIMGGMKEPVEELVDVLTMGIPSAFVKYFRGAESETL